LTKKFLEKFLKKLIGKTDTEDALKRLDKLTNEEVRMATAQVLRAAHTIDDRLRVVDDRVLNVDDRVAGIDDRVTGVNNRVASVDDRVKAVDDKVAVVIDGAQPSLVSHQGERFNSDVSRGKRDKGSHATSGRRHGSSETLVTFFLR
jgi:archaellum component FlaC